ncbi:MAG TPA: hypothetical protein VLV87_03240 [Gammaproteobacteria bacterium]|nr:hypothetical protein [Gammaproteobacteria bacterium]
MKRLTPLLIVSGFFLSSGAHAYEPDTHRRMSDKAALDSVMVKPPVGTTSTVCKTLAYWTIPTQGNHLLMLRPVSP